MQKFLSCLLTLAFLIPIAACSQSPVLVKSKKGKSGIATCQPEVYDFGKVYLGEVLQIPLVIKSTGKAPVSIESFVITDTDGSIEDWSVRSVHETPFFLEPGKTAVIFVIFRPSKLGKYTTTLSIETDSQLIDKLLVDLRAYVVLQDMHESM